MSWWSIIKISDDAKRNIMGRFDSKKDTKKPKSVGQSFGTKGKDSTSAYKNCDMCGKRTSLRAINYYPPMKALCNQCAKFKYGKDYKSMQTRIEPDW